MPVFDIIDVVSRTTAQGTGESTYGHGLGVTPKLAIVLRYSASPSWVVGETTADTVGATDGAHSFSVNTYNGKSGSNNVSRRIFSESFIRQIDSTTPTYRRANFVSWNASQIVLDWVSVLPAANTFSILLIGGDDFDAYVGHTTMPSTTGNQVIADVGFEGKALMIVNAGGLTTLDTINNAAALGIGFADGNSSVHHTINTPNNSQEQSRRYGDDGVIATPNAADGVVVRRAVLDSFDEDGFTLDWITVSGTPRFGYVVFGGEGLRAQVGIPQVSGANQDIPTPDMLPRAVIATSQGANDTLNTSSTSHITQSFGFGLTTEDKQRCRALNNMDDSSVVGWGVLPQLSTCNDDNDTTEDTGSTIVPQNGSYFRLNNVGTAHLGYLALGVQAEHELTGSSELEIQGQGQISFDHELEGAGQVEIGATGTIAGGLAVLSGGAEIDIEGTGEMRGMAVLEGQSQVAVQGSANIVISDYNFKWSIDFLEARSDHGYPTVYAEVSSTAMPTGAFPEGAFFERRLLEMPRLEEAEFGERFGITGFQRVTLALDNSDGLISSLDLTDAYVRLFFVSEAGDVREWKGRVTEWTLSHRCVVSVEDMDAVALTEELPRRTLNDIVEAEKEADPGFESVAVANDLGRPIPIIFGRAVKVPLLYIKADEAAREYDYIIGEGVGLGGGNFTEVFTVYREDQALDDIEGDAQSGSSIAGLQLEAADRRPDSWYKYWWIQITAGPGAGSIRHATVYNSTLNIITPVSNFSAPLTTSSDYQLREWRFYDGSQAGPYAGCAFIRFKKRLGVSGNTDALYADVNGLSAETNVVRAVQSILSNQVWGLGLDIDSDSFDAAAALPEIADMLCEGAITDNTTITDILNGSGESQGLLSFRDMVLSKSDAVTIAVDGPKSSAHNFGLGDETGWNNIMTESPEITHLHSGERVKNLKVRYRKNNGESDLYLHELERPSGGSGVDKVLTLPFVYGHDTADRWLDYRRKRLAAAVKRMAIETGQEGGSVRRGERVTVSVPTLGLEESAWEVAGCGITPAGSNSLTLVPYSAAPYTYVPVTDEGGVLPSDEFFDIAPDYTKTPPDPVSGASVSYTNDLSPEGQRQTFAVVTFTPPEDNFDHAAVSIRKNGATNWESAGSGTDRVRIKVTAGFFMDYLIVPYNVHGLAGLATTISNSLVPGDSAAPATPTGLTGTVKLNIAEWTWNKNSEADLAGYEYEIRTASSTTGQQAGNGSVVASGFTADNRVPSYKLTDGSLTTVVTRHLRVRSIDHTAKATGAAGNKSQWTATFPLSNGDLQRLDVRNGEITGVASGEVNGPITAFLNQLVSATISVFAGSKVEIWAHCSVRNDGITNSGGASYALRRGTTQLQVKREVHRGLSNSQTTSWVWHVVDTNPGTGNVTYNVAHVQGDTQDALDLYISVEELKR